MYPEEVGVLGMRRMMTTACVTLAVLLAACGGSTEETTTTSTSTTTVPVATTSSSTTQTTVPLSTTTTPSLGATDTIYVVQADLTLLGYFDGIIDGIAGEETRAAIAKFQAEAGVEADGEFGPVTDGELTPLLEANTDYVEQVQEALQELDLYSGPIDGDLGSGTRAAIEQAQAGCDVEETGSLDIATRLCLFAP